MAARGCRGDVVLASKVMGGSRDPRSFVAANRTAPPRPDAPPPRLDGPQIAAAVEGSLRRLQTGYLDLLQLHWPDRYAPLWGKNQYDAAQEVETVPFEETVAAIGALIAAGKGGCSGGNGSGAPSCIRSSSA